MSKYAHWYEDAEHSTLVAVVTPGEKPTVMDGVLAYGLAWQHNRDLLLLVPEDMVTETLGRLDWFETEIRAYRYDGNDEASAPKPIPHLGRTAVLQQLAVLPARIPKQGSLKPQHATWLDGVETTGLTSHDRGGYLSWHHEGLRVLHAAETRTGLRVRAGVQYNNPPPGRELFDKTFDTAPTPGEVAVINAKVALAVEDGGSLTSRMSEHKMQATLISQPDILGLTHLWREFPAWRGLTSSNPTPAGRPGYIDFLGADSAGHFHVIETKIGDDPKVVIQALDYAIWVTANDTAIREQLKAAGHLIPTPTGHQSSTTAAPVHLVLGAAETGPAFNAYLAAQIEALSGDCRVHIHLTAEPTANPIALQRLHARDMWTAAPLVAAPVTGPRWPSKLTAELADRNT